MADLFKILSDELDGYGLTVTEGDERYGGFIVTCKSSGQFAATICRKLDMVCGWLEGQFVLSPNYSHLSHVLLNCVAKFNNERHAKDSIDRVSGDNRG